MCVLRDPPQAGGRRFEPFQRIAVSYLQTSVSGLRMTVAFHATLYIKEQGPIYAGLVQFALRQVSCYCTEKHETTMESVKS